MSRSGEIARLQAMLVERDKMLKTAHHRFRNNLQILASSAHLRSKEASDSASVLALADLRHRIHAIAAIYRALDTVGHSSKISADMFVPEICSQMSGPDGSRVVVSTMVCDIALDVNSAIVLAMLVVEAVMLVFRRQDDGSIRVMVQMIPSDAGDVALTVADDASAPQDSFPDSAELAMISGYVRQLRGRLTACRKSGYALRVDLPLNIAAAKSDFF